MHPQEAGDSKDLQGTVKQSALLQTEGKAALAAISLKKNLIMYSVNGEIKNKIVLNPPQIILRWV